MVGTGILGYRVDPAGPRVWNIPTAGDSSNQESAMFTLQIEHKIKDFGMWKGVVRP
jgi:hypothetical protein